MTENQVCQSAPKLRLFPDGWSAKWMSIPHRIQSLWNSAPAAQTRDKLLLEISDAALKAVVFEKKAEALTARAASQPFSSGQTKNNLSASVVTEAIETTLKHLGMTPPIDCRILILGKGIYMAEADKPETHASGKDLAEAMTWQIAEKVTFPIEEAKVLAEKRTQDRVLVAALQDSKLQEILKGAHDAGLHPERVTLLPLAYEGLHDQYGLFPQGACLLVHVGRDQTAFIIYDQGQFKLQRDMALGGEHITQSMMGMLMVENAQVTIGYQEAEALKQAIGLPTADLMPNPDEPKLSQLSARVRPIFEKMISEIRSTIIQYQKNNPQGKIEHLYLSGDEALLKGFDDYLAQQLGFNVEILNAGKAAVGGVDPGLLALAGTNGLDQSRGVNFASMEDVWSHRLDQLQNRLKALILVTGMVLGICGMIMGTQAAWGQKEKKGLEARFKSLGDAAQKIELINATENAIRDREAKLKPFIPEQPYWGAALRELSQIVPEPMLLKKIEFSLRGQTKHLQLSGLVHQDVEAPDLVVSSFLENLNQSVLFQNSSLESRARVEGERPGLQFLIATDMVVPYES